MLYLKFSVDFINDDCESVNNSSYEAVKTNGDN